MSFATTTSPIHTNFKIRANILELQPSIVQWRRDFHRFPELGFKEKRTSTAIAEKLTAWGIPHQTGIAQTGIVARITGAKYLWEHRDDFSGTVKIIFQPAEEGPGGAKPMIEAGVLANPTVDAIIGLHLWNNLPLGTVGVRSGALMAATEFFHCKITGRGGHGALPQQTIDSILVAAQVVNAIHTIVARNVSPLESAVISIGEFHAGSAVNVIADSAKLSGTVRYFNPEVGMKIASRLEEVIAGVCASHGATYDLQYHKLYPAVINDYAIAELVRSVAENVIETPEGIVPECQTMGGEDMSFFLEAVPGCYFFLGSANPDKGLAYPHHHPRFNFDETALATGVEIFVRCVEKFLN